MKNINNIINNIMYPHIKKTKKRKPLTPEQYDIKNLKRLIRRIYTGDFTLSNKNDRKLYYLGLKKGVIDKELNVLKEIE